MKRFAVSALMSTLLIAATPKAQAQQYTVRMFVQTVFVELTPTQRNAAINEIESRPVHNGPYPGRFPEASTRSITRGDLEYLSCPSLWVMRNEIYARHGRPFRDPEVRRYFESQSWYKKDPTFRMGRDETFRLTALEKRNAAFILDYEKKHRCDL